MSIGSASGSVSLSSSGSGSERSGEDGSSWLDRGSGGQLVGVGRIPMETITETREDLPKEVAESSWLAKARNISRNILALERVSVIDCVCHDQEGASEEFFYMYMCHFSQLYVRLPFDDFTMGVVVKEPKRSYFYTDDRTTKFPFSWTNNPWQYKDMKREKLSLADKEVVDTLTKFNCHMAQVGKKNLNLFQALRKEKVAKVKAAGNTKVPNLQDPLVEVHVHGGSKRKAEVPAKQGGGKDVKRVKAALLGPGSSVGAKKPKAGLFELLETTVRRDIEINLSESLVNSIDNMELNAMIKAMLEFNRKALILGRGVGTLYHRELKEGNRSKMEELQVQVAKHVEEKATWKKEREEWLEERKR
ncbi:hypothetical protein DEO72_LG3g1222 [Vigna unguiculata]|uniref:Uncharacterized protein n=1 Tax=Vigna unguiculata TaxID=3917 RepID=A0A4D6LDP9_VIGUN|nr:hypothetical protein DEO72_LG3g1222 [Vigna unguiculata]